MNLQACFTVVACVSNRYLRGRPSQLPNRDVRLASVSRAANTRTGRNKKKKQISLQFYRAEAVLTIALSRLPLHSSSHRRKLHHLRPHHFSTR